MKKTNLSISYEEEKVKALRWYLEQKGTGLEQELGKSLETLFQKNVPANVRGYITRESEAASDGSEPKTRRQKPESPAGQAGSVEA